MARIRSGRDSGKSSDKSTETPSQIYHSSDDGMAQRIAGMRRRHDNDFPLWRGPCAEGDLGGVTQSMLARFFGCRERFRLKYVCGLEPHDKWNHKLGYGNMWHVCEETLAQALAVQANVTPAAALLIVRASRAAKLD